MKLSRLEVIFLLGVVLVHLSAVLAPVDSLLDRWFTTDDAFYYFQVARNISEGKGSTLDGIHASNGYHPLWMAVLIPVFSLARVDLVLPLRLTVLLSVLISAGTGILLYRFLSRSLHPALGMLAAALWVFFPPIHQVVTRQGMEAGLNAFFVMLLLVEVQALLSRPAGQDTFRDALRLGCIGALTLFSRLDNIFFVGFAGVVLIFRERRAYLFWLGYLIAGVSAGMLAFFLRVGFPRFLMEFQRGLDVFVGVSTLLKLLMGFGLGLFTPVWKGWRKELLGVALNAGLSAAAGGVAVIGLSAAGVVGSFPRLTIVLDAVLSGVFFLAVRRGMVRKTAMPDEALSPMDELRRALPLWLKRGLGYFLPLGGLLIAYMLMNLQVFGTPTPVSGQVKHWWGTIADVVYVKPVHSIPALFGVFSPLGQSPWWFLFQPVTLLTGGQSGTAWTAGLLLFWLGVVLEGVRRGVQRRGGQGVDMLTVLFMACLMHILYYTSSDYANMRPWYWVNETLAGMMLLFFALDGWWAGVPAPGRETRVRLWSALACAGLWLWGSFQVLESFALQKPTVPAYYLQEAAYLEAYTPPQSKIGMPGGGATAYFVRHRTVINLDGLINSYAYFQSLKDNRGREFLDRLGLDYVFGASGVIEQSAPYYTLLAERLEPVGEFEGFRLYRYRVP
ncbi:hypothetical protein [Anaerolinea sp.]|uniref:hypothetical protein n=1 Tax=Anaerolinea sp. TaxID=1872519 RepID=UPI002ACDC41B|nr:hypothetical protein [Anaerolinea sp.]